MVQIKLGPVAETKDHDYRQFFHALLLNFAVVILFGYLWNVGVIATWITNFHLHYNVAFAALLLAGCITCLVVTWKISRGLNAVKRADGMSSQEIIGLFGVPLVEDEKHDRDLLKEIVRDTLGKHIDTLAHIANLAVILGIVGTIDGLTQTFGVLTAVKAEDVMAKLPEMARHLVLFGTSMIGIIVYTIVRQMFRFARSGAYDLKHRIFRALKHKA
jgi:hypothetical protein